MKLGISGNLTKAFIASPLTPLILLSALMLGGIALVQLPREEEPQISVPMVDIQIQGGWPQSAGRGAARDGAARNHH